MEQVFIDRMSGKNTDRPELKKMMNFVREGDTVIVESISRFARNTKDLLDLVEQLTAKRVEFISKKEAIDNTLYTWLERFCKEENISFKGLHSFRHSVATQAITNGIDVKTVSSLLGHSQTSTIVNIKYPHKFKVTVKAA